MTETSRSSGRARFEILPFLDVTHLDFVARPKELEALAQAAVRPGAQLPSCAAVCVYPASIPAVGPILVGTPVKLAVVAGGFPHGKAAPAALVAEVAEAVAAGAQEVDVCIDHDVLLDDPARLGRVLDAQVAAAGPAAVKVIIESALLDDRLIRLATRIAAAAGASFVKTSTGMAPKGGATLSAVQSIADELTCGGFASVGVKVSGGVSTPERAWEYLDAVASLRGSQDPTRLRFGSSSLLGAITGTAVTAGSY